MNDKFYLFSKTLTISAANGNDEAELQLPTTTDMIVDDVLVSVYASNGAVVLTGNHDQLLAQLSDALSNESYFNQAVPLSQLHRINDNGLRPLFTIKAGTKLKWAVSHGTAIGTPVLTAPYTIHLTLRGRKAA